MKRFLLCLLCCICFALLCSAAAEEITGTQGEMLAAENADYRLLLTYEKGKTLQFAVESKATGFRWCSSPAGWEQSSDKKKRMQTGSQLIVTTLEKSTKASYTANSQVSSVGEDGTSVHLVQNGFRVDYDFPRAKDRYKVPVVYTLDRDGLRAELIMTGIEEYGDVYVQSVSLLPNFFAAEPDQPGYLLIPDGCGALIGFQGYRKGMDSYKQSVYGRDPALTTMQKIGQSMPVTLPVLGIHTENSGVLMIAEDGASLASVCACPAGSATVYSSAFFEFTYRAADTMKLADKSWYATDVTMVSPVPNNRRNAAVVYRFLEGEDSGYVAMAGIYRTYLQEKAGFPQPDPQPEIHLDLYGGIKKERSVLGVVVTDLLPMTTFAQAETILNQLKRENVSHAAVSFHGWNKGGLQDRVQSAASPEKKLGGRPAFDRLTKEAEKLSYTLLFDTDILRIYETDLSHNALFGTAQTVTGDAAAQYTFQTSTYRKNEKIDPYYLLAPALIPEVSAGLLRGLPAGKASLSSLGSLLYSDFRYNAGSDREMMLQTVCSLLAEVRGTAGTVAVSQGNAYSLPYADRIDQVPVLDSNYQCALTDVPFVPIVLHGWKNLSSAPVNLSGDRETFFLRLLETGVNPCYAITWESSAQLRDTSYEHLLSTRWEQQFPLILHDWKIWNEVMDSLCCLQIADHRILGDVRCTVYENGTRVYVNYGTAGAEADGIAVPARGYRVIRKGDET